MNGFSPIFWQEHTKCTPHYVYEWMHVDMLCGGDDTRDCVAFVLVIREWEWVRCCDVDKCNCCYNRVTECQLTCELVGESVGRLVGQFDGHFLSHVTPYYWSVRQIGWSNFQFVVITSHLQLLRVNTRVPMKCQCRYDVSHTTDYTQGKWYRGSVYISTTVSINDWTTYGLAHTWSVQ